MGKWKSKKRNENKEKETDKTRHRAEGYDRNKNEDQNKNTQDEFLYLSFVHEFKLCQNDSSVDLLSTLACSTSCVYASDTK